MNYIDFDNVILDTYLPIFKDYHDKSKIGTFIDDANYVMQKDWAQILRESPIINDGIEIIKTLDIAQNCILTKIHSLTNEGSSKIIFLRESGIACPIILVPYNVSKTDVVNAKDNVLVDDNLLNLNEWYQKGGISIFFSKDDLDVDAYGRRNTIYPKTRTLKVLRQYQK